MVARNVYRSVELLQEWEGTLNTQDQWTIALNGTLMFLAIVVLDVRSPGRLLKDAAKEKGGNHNLKKRAIISDGEVRKETSEASVA